MIDFDLSRRPVRPSDWAALAGAVLSSADPDEYYWLEVKTELSWSTPHGLGTLARAILGMSNRDPVRAGTFLEGTGIVLVAPSTRTDFPVAVIDSADLENKLSTFLGRADGPRWQPHWVKANEDSVLIVEVDSPRNGDPGYTLRQKFDDYRASQTFVRIGTKTVIADQTEMDRLARRLTAPDVEESLAIEVGVAPDIPLSRYYWEEADTEAFLAHEEAQFLFSLENPEQSEPVPGLSPAIQSLIASVNLSNGLTERREEDRTEEAYRAEVTAYIEGSREAMNDALMSLAKNVLPMPIFWVSNLSKRNFKEVEVTLWVEGMVEAADATNEEELTLRALLPKRPRRFGPYTVQTALAGMFSSMSGLGVPYIPDSLGYGRREIRNGGSFEIDFDALDLRPSDREVVLDSDLVILVPRDRPDPVIVHWRATASNVDAVAEGEFELLFEDEPIDLFHGQSG